MKFGAVRMIPSGKYLNIRPVFSDEMLKLHEL